MVLENKLGITNSSELAREEERLSKKRALELFETQRFNTMEAGTFKALKEIHKYLFQDVYDFAGELRTRFRFLPKLCILQKVCLRTHIACQQAERKSE